MANGRCISEVYGCKPHSPYLPRLDMVHDASHKTWWAVNLRKTVHERLSSQADSGMLMKVHTTFGCLRKNDLQLAPENWWWIWSLKLHMPAGSTSWIVHDNTLIKEPGRLLSQTLHHTQEDDFATQVRYCTGGQKFRVAELGGIACLDWHPDTLKSSGYPEMNRPMVTVLQRINSRPPAVLYQPTDHP